MKAGLLAEEAVTVVPQVAAVPVAAGGGSKSQGTNDVPVLTSDAPMEVEGKIMRGIHA
eukprot:COSAG03_NODE_368_length_8526_cov_6.102053_10_plen_58_part_00